MSNRFFFPIKMGWFGGIASNMLGRSRRGHFQMFAIKDRVNLAVVMWLASRTPSGDTLEFPGWLGGLLKMQFTDVHL